MEKKEARAEKEEAEKYQKLQDDLVSLFVAAFPLASHLSFFLYRLTPSCRSSYLSCTTMNVKLMSWLNK